MEPNYQYLGKKTLFLLILKRSSLFFLFLVVSIAFFMIAQKLEGNLSMIFGKISFYLFLAALAFLIIAIFSACLVYINYRFLLDENAFKVRRGILHKDEVAIPYRQIQNVNIKRSFFDQIIGLSKLVILTAGREDKDEKIWSESEGILPSLDKNIAREIQEVVLKRANIEQVVMR